MDYRRRKVFVSYHHANDQNYANQIRDFYSGNDTIIDRSLPQAFDSEDNDYILSQIRQKHLRDSTVTIVLIGKETWARKWVDWEIYSSLRPYGERKVNGLLGILLPGCEKLPPRFDANYREEQSGWNKIQTGYARLIRWSDIDPPFMWQHFSSNYEGRQKRDTLIRWIEDAYSNREKSILIDNSLPRFKNNRSSTTWW